MMQDPSGEVHVPVITSDEPDAITKLFTYHAPDDKQRVAYGAIRLAAMRLARVIDEHCSASPDRTAAIRKLRECVMTANASIATGGGHYR